MAFLDWILTNGEDDNDDEEFWHSLNWCIFIVGVDLYNKADDSPVW